MRDIPAAVAACFADEHAETRPLHLISESELKAWLDTRAPHERRWLERTGFRGKSGTTALLPSLEGDITGAVSVVGATPDLWDIAVARAKLADGAWRLADHGLVAPADAAIAWLMAAYRFERYKSAEGPQPKLHVAENAARRRATAVAEAIWLARDLVTTPTNDLGPDELQAAAFAVGERFGASRRAIVGPELLEANYPMIHAVGRASSRQPRLIELTHGRGDALKLTLVGKGVCFDTGGLDIKPSAGMLMMRKDMGGGALMLGLAQAVLALGLEVRLRLLIPAVENSISGDAFRPGDILRSRKGLTVEIGNTDAEGRLILADALADADAEKPDLLLDAATLTGAARVALGPDLPALFTPDDAVARDLLAAGETSAEPLWRLPLHKPYAKYIESPVADLNNSGSKPLAGAITAALFLQRFVEQTKAWAHLDIFAWNDEGKPGRPKGGEATAFRPLLALIEGRFGAR